MDRLTDISSNWAPFNRPLFENAKVRDLSRVGVIDVGSNSVRLVVFDGAARSPAYFFNEKVVFLAIVSWKSCFFDCFFMKQLSF